MSLYMYGLKLGLLSPTKAQWVCLLLLSRYELFPPPFFPRLNLALSL